MRIRMLAALVLVVVVLASAVLTAPLAASNVLWKQNCPRWADISIIEEGKVDRHVVCSVGDLNGQR